MPLVYITAGYFTPLIFIPMGFPLVTYPFGTVPVIGWFYLVFLVPYTFIYCFALYALFWSGWWGELTGNIIMTNLYQYDMYYYAE